MDESTMPAADERPSLFEQSGHLSTETLVGLSEGILSDEDRARVLEHLAECDRCRELSAELGREVTQRQERDTASLGGDPLVGATVGEYKVVEKLSQGGMGAVYGGLHPVIGKPVAIKVLLPEVVDTDGHRLLAEARAVNAIEHPHIVDIFGFGQLPDGRQYFVMELLEGRPLSVVLRSVGRLDTAMVLAIIEQTASALHSAHLAGVVHRDLKPSNIFVNGQGEELWVTLLDFGVAKSVTAPIAGVHTLPGAVLGTPGFMAPEQIRGVNVGPPADIYALGVTAYLLLCGEEPFDGRSTVDLMLAHLNREASSLRSKGVAVPPELDALVASMMAKDAAARPTASGVKEKAALLRRELARATTRIVKAAPPASTVPETVRAARPAVFWTPARAAAAVLGVAVLTAVAVFVAWKTKPVAPTRPLLTETPPRATPPPVMPPPDLAPAEPPEPTETEVAVPEEARPGPVAPAVLRRAQRGPTRAQVEARLKRMTRLATALESASQRRLVELQLKELNDRFAAGAAVAELSTALDQLSRDYDLRER